MDPANEEPSYWLESSYYGPGALLGWYLTFASIIINWIWHPTARFAKLKASNEIIAFLTYPCLAAGHLVRQIALFEPRNRPLIQFDFYLPDLLWHDEVTNDDPIAPSLRNTISAINAPFRICIIAITITSIVLLEIASSPSISRPRRTKPLPWAFLLAHLCILTCLGCIPIIWGQPNLYFAFIRSAWAILFGLFCLVLTLFLIYTVSFSVFMLIANLLVYSNLKRPSSRLLGEKYYMVVRCGFVLFVGASMLEPIFLTMWAGLWPGIPGVVLA